MLQIDPVAPLRKVWAMRFGPYLVWAVGLGTVVLVIIQTVIPNTLMYYGLIHTLLWILVPSAWFSVVVIAVAVPLPPLDVLRPKEERTGVGSNVGWGLVMKNPNTTFRAIACSALLEEIAPESSTSSLLLADIPTDRPFHWATGGKGDSVDIAAGALAHLNVAYRERLENDDNDDLVTLAYEASPEFRRQQHLPFDEPILVRLSITYDGSVPQYVVCRLNLQAMKNAIVQALIQENTFSLENTFSIRYKGPEPKPLSQFRIPSPSTSLRTGNAPSLFELLTRIPKRIPGFTRLLKR